MASIITTIQSKLTGSGKKALLLGAGFVTKPTVDILAKSGVEVIVGKLRDVLIQSWFVLMHYSMQNPRVGQEAV